MSGEAALAPADGWVPSNPANCSQFEVGGVSLRFTGVALTERDLGPVLELFRVTGGAPDIDIQIDWAPRLVPSVGLRLFDSGTTWRLYESKDAFQFDFNSPAFGDQPYKRLIVDRSFRRAILYMNEESFARFPSESSPLEYPLDELLIMHRLTQEKAIELHSCGIVRPDGTGNLFVGHSGAGKSTTTRLWTEREDVEVLSDDRIIVRRDEGAGVQIPCRAAGGAGQCGVVRLRDRSASPTGHFAQDDRLKTNHSAQDDKPKTTSGLRMYGTPWHGEAMYASPNSAPLSRIFILEHGHGNVLTRLSPSHAVAELFARSFVPFHRHEYVDSALDFLQELVDSVPCYHFAFEPDQRAVEAVLNFRD
jgi:hypothetical protein